MACAMSVTRACGADAWRGDRVKKPAGPGLAGFFLRLPTGSWHWILALDLGDEGPAAALPPRHARFILRTAGFRIRFLVLIRAGETCHDSNSLSRGARCVSSQRGRARRKEGGDMPALWFARPATAQSGYRDDRQGSG